MDFIDVFSMVQEFGGKLDNVVVMGKIVSRLPRPNNLFQNVHVSSEGSFVRMQVFAVDLSNYTQVLKTRGISHPDNIFMVNGSIALVINEKAHKLPDWYAVRGTLRMGSKTGFPYLTMFKFIKGSDNNWNIGLNELDNVYLDTWNHSTLAYSLARSSMDNGTFEQSPEVVKLPMFFAQPQTDMPTIPNVVQEGVSVKPSVTNSVMSFKKESRSEVKEFNPMYNELLELEKASVQLKKDFCEEVAKTYTFTTECNEYIKQFAKALYSNFTRKATSFCYTGRVIMRDYLSTFGKLAEAKYLNTTALDYLVKSAGDVCEYIIHGETTAFDSAPWKLCNSAFGDPELFYAFALAKVTGNSTDDFMRVADLCGKNNISFSSVVMNNPYLLQSIGGLKFEVVELLAEALNLSRVKENRKYRNIAMLDSYFNGSSTSNTVFIKDQLVREQLGVSLTPKKYDMCRKYGTYINDTVFDNIVCYFKPDVIRQRIDLSAFEKRGYGYIEKVPYATLNETLKDYVDSGLGVCFDKYVTSSNMLKKELFVYKYMYDLGNTSTDFTSEEIDGYIKEYEEIVGFTLEEKQREGVHLLEKEAGIVSGGAGSGKTTTSNCFVYCLDRHYGDSANIKFATPTGKAAKRMQEVVKRPVKTMCSMFKTMVEEENLFDKEEVTEAGNGCIYLFDENAMVTLDLLYNCLRKINNSSIYLFGDFNQLPPIGKGLPFKNLLRFMPCVFLNVSKRAKSGSNITKNSDIINNNSDSNNWAELESGDDFLMYECAEESLADVTKMLCKYYLGKGTEAEEAMLRSYFKVSELPKVDGLTDDDIQVVTPLSKATYTWGATRLNSLLQPVFNTNRGVDKTFAKLGDGDNYDRFIIGDRVIHTNQNMYAMQWYETYKDGIFKKRYGFGISNGEVGKVVAFYPATTCEFEDETEDMPEDFEYPKNLRNDSNWCKDEDWFVVVEYYDYMSESNFYILYRCTEDLKSEVSVGKPFRGTDLSMLNLFYAGTTHKMQGSQGKIIISPLGSVNYKGFITRNMMYTLYTRGVNLVFAFGSVGNTKNSMLSRARAEVSEGNTLTLGELLGN